MDLFQARITARENEMLSFEFVKSLGQLPFEVGSKLSMLAGREIK